MMPAASRRRRACAFKFSRYVRSALFGAIHVVTRLTPARSTPAANTGSVLIDSAKAAYQNATAGWGAGGATLDEVIVWSDRLFAAQRESLSGKALADAARERVQDAKKFEALAAQRVQAGAASSVEIKKTAYFRANAEIELAHLAP